MLISNEGIAKLADFGIASFYDDENKIIEDDEKEIENNDKKPKQKHSKNRIKGSPYWMAPEIISLKQVTPSCDIWAVGATAIELYTGMPPYSELGQMSALFRIVHDPHPKLPPNISDLFKDFLLQCFIKDPLKRPTASKLLSHAWLKSHDFNGYDY